MPENSIKNSEKITLAIHCTDNSFGFATRINNNIKTDSFFIKKFEKDLCNNLIVDFNKFISRDNLKKVDNISVSIGPANFNASRLIVVLARTISQQKNCEIKSFSSFELMAKRIALKNNIYKNDKFFWIYKKLKRKGYIAGKYEICLTNKQKDNLSIVEIILPKLFHKIIDNKPFFEASYDDNDDLKQLLNLSTSNCKSQNNNSWDKILPIYPLSPIN